jgi:anterior pharynx defective protein 1
MGLSDARVNWPLFLGSILTAFGPLAAFFFVVISKRAQLVIISLFGAFTWLASILVTATLWQIIPPLKNSIEATIPVGIVIQEIFRFVFFELYTRTERAIQKVTTRKHQLPLNDVTSSLGTYIFILVYNYDTPEQ